MNDVVKIVNAADEGKALGQSASSAVADIPVLTLYMVIYTLITLMLFYSLAAFVLSASTSIARSYIQSDEFGAPPVVGSTPDAYTRLKWRLATQGIGQIVLEWQANNEVDVSTSEVKGLPYSYIRVRDYQKMPMALVRRTYSEQWVAPTEKFYADHEEQ